MQVRTYKHLETINEYDKERVEDLVEAIQEAEQLKGRLDYLMELIKENKKLNKYIWTDQNGDKTAIHQLRADHLANIMNYYIVERGATIPKTIRSEARSRGIPVPINNPSIRLLDIDGDAYAEYMYDEGEN